MLDPDHRPFVPTMTPYMFSTPLRSLVSKDLTNLFFAGRLASFSHVVYGSQRVMRTCATMGQAVGTAAAYAVSHNLTPIVCIACENSWRLFHPLFILKTIVLPRQARGKHREHSKTGPFSQALKDSPEAVWSIQQQLLRDDAFVIGVLNEDPRDYAQNATVTTTSETLPDHKPGDQKHGDQKNGTLGLDGRAVNVISGQSRAVTGALGVAPGQGLNGTNRWISTVLPAAITLQLASAAPITQVQLVFDTGMHRKLNFNPVGEKKDALHWSPQPETARDYVIEGQVTAGGDWTVLCNVSGNYMRSRVHSLPCTEPGPEPGPAPGPAPPQIADGALEVDLCTGATGQMWSLDNATGTISTVVAGSKYCLGFSKNLSAFGGVGSAVVALPCEEEPTAWSLAYPPTPKNATGTTGGGGGGALLKTVKSAPCLGGATVACDADKAKSVTIAGAGDAKFNGVYIRDAPDDEQEDEDGAAGQLSFSKDSSHQLYEYGGMWHLGETGVSVAYTSKVGGLDGPPMPSGWETEGVEMSFLRRFMLKPQRLP